MPIYLTEAMIRAAENGADDVVNRVSGLTKREMFAMAAMQGLLVNMGRNGLDSVKQVAAHANAAADALLTELERTK